jgi:hypothetical protein
LHVTPTTHKDWLRFKICKIVNIPAKPHEHKNHFVARQKNPPTNFSNQGFNPKPAKQATEKPKYGLIITGELNCIPRSG